MLRRVYRVGEVETPVNDAFVKVQISCFFFVSGLFSGRHGFRFSWLFYVLGVFRFPCPVASLVVSFGWPSGGQFLGNKNELLSEHRRFV